MQPSLTRRRASSVGGDQGRMKVSGTGNNITVLGRAKRPGRSGGGERSGRERWPGKPPPPKSVSPAGKCTRPIKGSRCLAARSMQGLVPVWQCRCRWRGRDYQHHCQAAAVEGSPAVGSWEGRPPHLADRLRPAPGSAQGLFYRSMWKDADRCDHRRAARRWVPRRSARYRHRLGHRGRLGHGLVLPCRSPRSRPARVPVGTPPTGLIAACAGCPRCSSPVRRKLAKWLVTSCSYALF